MPIKKIQLVNAPNDEGASSSGGRRCYPHLGLLSIATLLQHVHPDISVEVIDGSVTPLDEILERLDADVVGVSVLTLTYARALDIAHRAQGCRPGFMKHIDGNNNMYYDREGTGAE